MSEPQNRLAYEKSPYLLQHAKNPVDWYPWGKAALERARAENKPILLSIGYAACHWCHVMERESFENEAIARAMNAHFVCIKVDREERPDLDEIYMSATVAMSGSGGWPMTVFLTPNQEPFFAGTYFPPDSRFGRPGFGWLLERIAALWQNDRDKLVAEAASLASQIRKQALVSAPGKLALESLAQATLELERDFDARFGGFGPAPKFPPSAALQLLMKVYYRTQASNVRKLFEVTLDAMKNGGMYDHLAGGFARYSTDDRWLVPHFEKMLYDNAELAKTYTLAFQLSQKPEYAQVACETLDYVVREMQGTEGGYFSATDADSEGEEGKYFVWHKAEITAILGEDSELFCAHYAVTEAGNWEGKNILHTPHPLAALSARFGQTELELSQRLAHCRARLYQTRLKRVPPLLDDKVLSAWNGLMLDAMCAGYAAFGKASYLDSAQRAANFLLSHMTRPDQGLYRSFRAGSAHLDGYLEDYAFVANGILSLYEVSAEPQFLEAATRLAQRMLDDFTNPLDGSFFATAHTHEALIARPREGHDGALPNANAWAARLLLRLAEHQERPAWQALALKALEAWGKMIERMPRAFATALSVFEEIRLGPLQLVLVGDATHANYREFLRILGQAYVPLRILALSKPEAALPSPLLHNKPAKAGLPTLYICDREACHAVLTDPDQLPAELDKARERQRLLAET